MSDGLLYLSGQGLVTSFQLQSYTTAVAEGWLPAMLFAAIIVAPAGEEITVSRLSVPRLRPTGTPGVAGYHRDRGALRDSACAIRLGRRIADFGRRPVFGWMRLRSGSIVLTFLLHALFNLEGTLETVAQVHFFAK